MQKERETENFVCLGADLKEVRKVLGLSRRALCEKILLVP